MSPLMNGPEDNVKRFALSSGPFIKGPVAVRGDPEPQISC